MKRVNNNTLFILLVFSIFVFIAATLISFYYIQSLNFFTGKATDDIGNITLSVGSTLSCTTDLDDIIAFPSMPRSNSNTSENVTDFINLSNDGNQNINATVNASEQLWDSASYVTPSTTWQIHCNSSTSGSCNTTYGNVQNSSLSHKVVYDLQPGAGSDQALLGFLVTIPADEPTGAKNGQVVFWCSAA
nr:hypothetical protein [Nanoarchaeum sp.]